MPLKNQPSLQFKNVRAAIYPSRLASGKAAAIEAAELIRVAIADHGHARIMVGTGNSQLAVVEALMEQPNINWGQVEAFHMDEYVGISPLHPASFRHWLKIRVQDKQKLAAIHFINGDTVDLDFEIARYTTLLRAAPLDIAFVGFGENGHIAFNDPPVADFADPAALKVVTLDPICRRQQVGEGHFKDVASVPSQAITVTCSELFRAKAWICCVPELRKAGAVRDALEGPVSTACPASIVRQHTQASIYLDPESASLLTSPLPKRP